MKKIFYITFVVIFLISISCKPKIDAPVASVGSIDPTRYVAIGNSITSGFADGALYYDGQLVAYPNLISGQFSLASKTTYTFNQPLMPSGSVGIGSTNNSRFVLGYSTDCLGITSMMPLPVAAKGDSVALFTNVYSQQGPFNNMGVPGARAIDVCTAGYADVSQGGNPFFYRMAKSSTSSSILSDALDMNPTFFSVFIGNNDALLYASNGAASGALTPSSGAVGVGFDASYDSIINSLTKNGAKGVIANIPDITVLPYFTTVPWNGLTLRQGQADTLNSIFASNGTPLYNFKAGKNPFLIKDPSAFLGKRLIKSDELILLSVPLDKIKCLGYGTMFPLTNEYVLTESEIQDIRTAINAYNDKIKSVAQEKGLAFVDVNAFMQQAQKGIVYNGVTLNAQFVTGGSFSLDGIHLNPIGNALLANEFLKAINSTYNASIPLVDPTKYRGCVFP